MKRIMLLTVLVYLTSCTNPEDHATGNADSTSFNTSEEKNLNTASDLNNTETERLDTSISPATQKENTNSKTSGTNRSYGAGTDSTKQ